MVWRIEWKRSSIADWALARAETIALAAGPDGAHCSPFDHPDFFAAWVASSPSEVELLLMDARHESGQRAVWLFWRPAGVISIARSLAAVGGWVRELPGWTSLAGYSEPVVAPAGPPGAVLRPGFWEALARSLADSGVGEGIFASHARPTLLGAPSGESRDLMHFIDLSPYACFESFLAARPSADRSEIRRKLRKIERAGSVELVLHGPEDVEGALGLIPRAAACQRARYGESTLVPEVMLENLARRAVPSGAASFSTLRLDGRDISYVVGLGDSASMHFLLCTFERDAACLSPGVVHFALLYQWLIERGVRHVAFGRGNHGYKSEWTDGRSWPIGQISVKSNSLRGAVLRSAGATVRRLRSSLGII